ncbi:SAM-dependent methyltransferase [Microbacterium karelineae]|uniref:SAM-dependent methyltransferase n=1 Tax=Microbacterium karelineae TaxID=2654283 RepID=UPI001E4BA881|nr:class I SAM-dependent methyltransferase [Microbacterium karelineae]
MGTAHDDQTDAVAENGGGQPVHQFDKTYWESHWGAAELSERRSLPIHPYIPSETAHLPAGTALDAGCGTGTEALWLAEQGWHVTGADISSAALATAAGRAASAGLDDRIEWIEADLARWEPDREWDLVVSSYAHADIGQLAFYQRIASWVAPGGTLLIIGHLHDQQAQHRHHAPTSGPPEEATAALAGITSLFTGQAWRIDAAYENTRTVHTRGEGMELRDVIVRAHRLT